MKTKFLKMFIGTTILVITYLLSNAVYANGEFFVNPKPSLEQAKADALAAVVGTGTLLTSRATSIGGGLPTVIMIPLSWHSKAH